MKKLFLFFAVAMLSLPSSAVRFREDTELPYELKVRIAALIAEKCPSVVGIEEVMTRSDFHEIDQGQRDMLYFTELSGSRLYDGVHPVGVRIFVDSVEMGISNPTVDRFEISALASDSDVCPVR